MKGFTFKKGRVGNGLFAHSFFKSFIVFVVMMIMTTSSASAERIEEEIDGLCYYLNYDTKTAQLIPRIDNEKYYGDIIIPEKVKGNDEAEYVVTSLGYDCFSGCSSLTSITIPSSVTSLGARCFKGCSGLTSITIPSSVTEIGTKCFKDCSGLTSIAIPSSVTLWDNYCFQGCSGLTSITIPSSVTSLGVGCFSQCSGLTTITIPSSVTFLGKICFNECDNIGTIYFKGKFPRMYNYDTGIAYTSSIKVPAEYLQDYKRILGSDYLYISAWNPDELGNDDKPVATCATPVISYESGELKFACETPGAKYHYTISDWDITGKNEISDDGKVSLSATYYISVYATADDHTASKKAKASIYWINANLETANINQAKTRGIMASAYDGIVSISGLNNGEVVKFYAADGKLLDSSSAVDGVASCAVSDSMVIAKIGMDSIKILMK